MTSPIRFKKLIRIAQDSRSIRYVPKIIITPHLFSIPISYGVSEKHTKTLTTCPREQKKKTHHSIPLDQTTPFTPCMDACKSQITVSAKEQYESNQHGDRKQNHAGSKQSKTVEETLQTIIPKVEDDAQPRRTQ